MPALIEMNITVAKLTRNNELLTQAIEYFGQQGNEVQELRTLMTMFMNPKYRFDRTTNVALKLQLRLLTLLVKWASTAEFCGREPETSADAMKTLSQFLGMPNYARFPAFLMAKYTGLKIITGIPDFLYLVKDNKKFFASVPAWMQQMNPATPNRVSVERLALLCHAVCSPVLGIIVSHCDLQK